MLRAIQKQLSRVQAKKKRRLNKDINLDTTRLDKEIKQLRKDITAAKECLKNYHSKSYTRPAI